MREGKEIKCYFFSYGIIYAFSIKIQTNVKIYFLLRIKSRELGFLREIYENSRSTLVLIVILREN